MKIIRSVLSCMLILALFTTILSGCGSYNKASSGDNGKSNTVTPTPTPKTVNYDGMSRVNVLSFNIYYQDVKSRAKNIIDLIKKGSADVIGLQEVTAEWRDYLNKAFIETEEFASYGFGRYGGDYSSKSLQSGEQFSLILYKTAKYELVKSGHFWCSSTPDYYSARWTDGLVSKFPRCINWVMLKDKQTGGEFVFVNDHLDPENETVRVYSAELITSKMKQIADGRLCILVGDWNSGLTKPSYSKIISGGFTDVRSIAAETTKLGTFNDWGKRDQASWAFGDIIFTNTGVGKVKKFNVLTDTYDGDYVSDHCPVVSEIYY